MIKKGDKVKVTDNSYAVKVYNKNKIATPGGRNNQESPVFEVLHTNLRLPTEEMVLYDRPYPTNNFNDTIIRQLSNGDIYYTQARFLKKVKKYILVHEYFEGIVEYIYSEKRTYYFRHGSQYYRIKKSMPLESVYEKYKNNNIYVRK